MEGDLKLVEEQFNNSNVSWSNILATVDAAAKEEIVDPQQEQVVHRDHVDSPQIVTLSPAGTRRPLTKSSAAAGEKEEHITGGTQTRGTQGISGNNSASTYQSTTSSTTSASTPAPPVPPVLPPPLPPSYPSSTTEFEQVEESGNVNSSPQHLTIAHKPTTSKQKQTSCLVMADHSGSDPPGSSPRRPSSYRVTMAGTVENGTGDSTDDEAGDFYEPDTTQYESMTSPSFRPQRRTPPIANQRKVAQPPLPAAAPLSEPQQQPSQPSAEQVVDSSGSDRYRQKYQNQRNIVVETSSKRISDLTTETVPKSSGYEHSDHSADSIEEDDLKPPATTGFVAVPESAAAAASVFAGPSTKGESAKPDDNDEEEGENRNVAPMAPDEGTGFALKALQRELGLHKKEEETGIAGFLNRHRELSNYLPVVLGPLSVVTFIVVMIVLAITGGGGGDGSGGTGGNEPPTVTPSTPLPPEPNVTGESLSPQQIEFLSILTDSIQSISSSLSTSWIQDESSPQFRALSWLSEDPIFLSTMDQQNDDVENPDNSTRWRALNGVGHRDAHLPVQPQEHRKVQASPSALTSSHDRKLILQRFAMATLYYSTDGDKWERNGFWLSESPVCAWYVNNFGRQCLAPARTPPTLAGRSNGDDGIIVDGDLDIGDFITQLELDGNGLRGTLPEELVLLPELHTVILTNNDLSGPLPSSLGRSDSLQFGGDEGTASGLNSFRRLHLDQNRFTGSIPEEWTNSLTDLQELKLDGNMLSGSIPTNFWRLSLLTELRLGGNPQLRGSISTEIGSWIALRKFHADSVGWTGTIPSQVGNCFQLQEIDLHQESGSSTVNFEGSIPTELWELPRLEYVDLSGLNLGGRLPIAGQLALFTSMLRTIRLSQNQLTGTIPTGIGSLTKLRILELRDNQLGGDTVVFRNMIPTEFGRLQFLEILDLRNNPRLGFVASFSSRRSTIPTEFGLLKNLESLDLSLCGLFGTVPSQLSQLKKLTKLMLSDNLWSGTIPSELGMLNVLEALHIGSETVDDAGIAVAQSRGLFGSIPESLRRSINLKSLAFPNNQLMGTIPSQLLTALTKLTHLDLSNNLFASTLPSELAVLTDLEDFVVPGNNLSGTIPSAYSSWKSLATFHIERNLITGEIDAEFCWTIGSLAMSRSVIADCLEVVCPCCTQCCTDDMDECEDVGT